MTSQVMFGKNGTNAPVQARRTAALVRPEPVSQTAPQPDPDKPRRHKKKKPSPYEGLENLNEVDFGRTFAMPYAPGKSMFVVFVLWVLGAGSGGHRFYLGDRTLGMAMAGLGVFNLVLWLTGGFTAYLSYKAGNGMITGGLISAAVVMVFHMGWTFFDFFYILVRKFRSP